MSTIFKDVIIPFDISQMETLGEKDNNIYIVSYKKSLLKGEDFIKYIINSSKICDVVDFDEIDSDIKLKMMKRLYSQPELVFLPCMAKSLVLALLVSKNITLAPDDYKNSFLTQDEIVLFLQHNEEKIEIYKTFFDSLFVYMITVSSLIVNNQSNEINYNDLIEKYKDTPIIDDEFIIEPNICSVFFEPLFYRYYEKPINENIVTFYKKQYTEKMFNGQTILSLLFNEANTILFSLIKLMETSKIKKPS